MNRISPTILCIALAGILLAGTSVGAQQNTSVSISQIKIDSIQFQEAEIATVLEYLGTKAHEMNGTPANFILYDPS